MRIVTALIVCACLSTAARAEELLFANGNHVVGKLVKTTEDSVTFQSADGSTMTVPAAQLLPTSFYHLRNLEVGDDAAARLSLAQYAMAHKLYHQARAQFLRAHEIDPDAAKAFKEKHLDEIHEGLAALLLEQARTAFANGDLRSARTQCTTLVAQYHDTKAAPDAQALLEKIQGAIDGTRAREQKEREANMKEEEHQALAPAVSDLRWGDQIRNKAVNEQGPTQAKNLFDEAGAKYRLAVERLEKLAKSDDTALAGEAQKLLKDAQHSGVECFIHAGEYYISRGNANEAQAEARKALEVEPDSAAAQSLLNEARNYNGSGSYWGVRWRGRAR